MLVVLHGLVSVIIYKHVNLKRYFCYVISISHHHLHIWKSDAWFLLRCIFLPFSERKFITVTSWWTRWRLKSSASRLFTQPFIQAQMKEKSKLRVIDLCAGNSRVTGEFPAQMATNAGNVFIWWCHQVLFKCNKNVVQEAGRPVTYHMLLMD